MAGMDDISLSPRMRFIMEVVLAACVGFMVMLLVLIPGVALLALLVGVPLGLLTWYLRQFSDV